MSIKKQFAEIHALLESSKTKKVSSIFDELVEMMSTKVDRADTTVRYDDAGNVTHIFCYYHKVWEDVSEHEYGVKKSTKSGLNTMCKAGVSNWTKQQNQYTKAKSELLDMVALGEITVDELNSKLEEIENKRKLIVE